MLGKWIFPLILLTVLSGESTYKAQKGDSYYRIAARYQINYMELAKLNHNKTLRAGDVIKVPIASENKSANVKDKTETTSEAFGKLQFVWPASGQIKTAYGVVDQIYNPGILITTTKKEIMAAEKGLVKFIGPIRGLGQAIMISHPEGYVTIYGGMDKVSVKVDDQVGRAQNLGLVDGTSFFFSIFDEGQPLNPGSVLGKNAR
jgi:septal ring factor EnvC (AmiA/AmiB activator)